MDASDVIKRLEFLNPALARFLGGEPSGGSILRPEKLELVDWTYYIHFAKNQLADIQDV